MCIYDYEQTINYDIDDIIIIIVIMYKCFVNFERSIRIGIQENKSQKKTFFRIFVCGSSKFPPKESKEWIFSVPRVIHGWKRRREN